MGKICNIKAEINGLYGWGEGYYSPKLARAFDEFWEIHKNEAEVGKGALYIGTQNSRFGFGKEVYLYGLYGGLNVHPMEITGILQTNNSANNENFSIAENGLKNILDKLMDFIKNSTGKEITYKITKHIIDEPKELYSTKKREEGKIEINESEVNDVSLNMTYEDFYDIAEYLNEGSRRSCTQKEIACNAYEYLDELKESKKAGKETEVIERLLDLLYESNPDVEVDYWIKMIKSDIEPKNDKAVKEYKSVNMKANSSR